MSAVFGLLLGDLTACRYGRLWPPRELESWQPSSSWDWKAANQRKIDAVRQLAPLADVLDDIEARIDQLVARTKDLELG